ncbi:MAG: alpha/beta hydrolase [Anaerolineaceae bacterium]|nr:alpha/beta hydrolase [Anaerolineaceae bacterium]
MIEVKLAITFKTIFTNNIQLHTAIAGPEDGEPVILLHGFPDAWFGWESQIRALGEAGFRVYAPDQRGYNLSDKPAGVSNYQIHHQVADIIGLADALGIERFHLGGHDFGAIVAWNLAMQHPKRLKKLVIANVPHPAVMRSFLKSNPSQMLKSWYAFFFQIPWLPEAVVRANNWNFLISAMPNYFSDQMRDRYRKAWRQPGAITGMINWYRASLRRMQISAHTPRIEVSTLILWGQQDPHIRYEMAALSLAYCDDGRLETFEDASHWVLMDEPEETSRLISEHFSI